MFSTISFQGLMQSIQYVVHIHFVAFNIRQNEISMRCHTGFRNLASLSVQE